MLSNGSEEISFQNMIKQQLETDDQAKYLYMLPVHKYVSSSSSLYETESNVPTQFKFISIKTKRLEYGGKLAIAIFIINQSKKVVTKIN